MPRTRAGGQGKTAAQNGASRSEQANRWRLVRCPFGSDGRRGAVYTREDFVASSDGGKRDRVGLPNATKLATHSRRTAAARSYRRGSRPQ